MHATRMTKKIAHFLKYWKCWHVCVVRPFHRLLRATESSSSKNKKCSIQNNLKFKEKLETNIEPKVCMYVKICTYTTMNNKYVNENTCIYDQIDFFNIELVESNRKEVSSWSLWNWNRLGGSGTLRLGNQSTTGALALFLSFKIE